MRRRRRRYVPGTQRLVGAAGVRRGSPVRDGPSGEGRGPGSSCYQVVSGSWSSRTRTNTARFHLHAGSGLVKVITTGRTVAVVLGWGWGWAPS